MLFSLTLPFQSLSRSMEDFVLTFSMSSLAFFVLVLSHASRSESVLQRPIQRTLCIRTAPSMATQLARVSTAHCASTILPEFAGGVYICLDALSNMHISALRSSVGEHWECVVAERRPVPQTRKRRGSWLSWLVWRGSWLSWLVYAARSLGLCDTLPSFREILEGDQRLSS